MPWDPAIHDKYTRFPMHLSYLKELKSKSIGFNGGPYALSDAQCRDLFNLESLLSTLWMELENCLPVPDTTESERSIIHLCFLELSVHYTSIKCKGWELESQRMQTMVCVTKMDLQTIVHVNQGDLLHLMLLPCPNIWIDHHCKAFIGEAHRIRQRMSALSLFLVPHLSAVWSAFALSSLSDTISSTTSAQIAARDFGLDPVINTYGACPKCASLYKPIALTPGTHCTYVSHGTRCGKPLYNALSSNSRLRLEVLTQPIIPWIGHLLNHPGKEALCESNLARVNGGVFGLFKTTLYA